MLARIERKRVPADSPLHADLEEVQGMTQTALDKVRSLSQMLHPAVIDDYGLEKAVEWYVPTFEKQTGIPVAYSKVGTGPAIKDETAIHVYRILQEALNNVARHSGSKSATVRVRYEPESFAARSGRPRRRIAIRRCEARPRARFGSHARTS